MLCSVLVCSSEIRCSSQFRRAHDILPRPLGYPGTSNRIQLCGVLWMTEAVSRLGAARSVRGFLHTHRETKQFWSYRITKHVAKLWRRIPGPSCCPSVTRWHSFYHVHLECRCVPYVLAAMLVCVLAPINLATTCFIQVVFNGLAWHSEAVSSTNRTGIIISMGTSTLLVFTNTRP